MDKGKKTRFIGWLQLGVAVVFLFFGQTDFHMGVAFIMIGQGLTTLKVID